MKFSEVVEYESGHPGTKFKRIDYDAKWYLMFEVEYGGLKMYTMNNINGPVTLFHHDFYDGEWEIIE